MSRKREWLKKYRPIIASICIGIALFSGSLTSSYMASAQKISVVSETGTAVPSEGSIWVNYNLTEEHEGFIGSIVIKKSYEDNYESSLPSKTYALTTTVPIELQAGEFKGRIKYNLGKVEINMGNQWHYDYEVKDVQGNILASGPLGGYKVSTSGMENTVLILGRDSGEVKAIKSRMIGALVVIKENLKDEDSSFLEPYKTVIMTHEKALTLSNVEKENLLKQMHKGTRLIIVSEGAHVEKNFIEDMSGQIFNQSGMSNLKSDINWLALKNDTKDHWQETAKTDSGKTMAVFEYGKGYAYQFGYNPFLLKSSSGENFEKELFQTLLYQTSMNLKMSSSDYGVSILARQLPQGYLPSLGLCLALFAVLVTGSVLMGIYLVRVKRLTSGMLIAMAGGTAISLVAISLSGLFSGYRGSLIGEFSYNKFYENQVDSLSYVGIKSNRKTANFQADLQTEVWLPSYTLHTESGSGYVNEVGEKNVWKIPRRDKWQMDIVAVSNPVNLPKASNLVKGFHFSKGVFKGELRNETNRDFENAILIAEGNAYPLGQIKAGQKFDLANVGNPVALKSKEGDYWEDSATLFSKESDASKGLNAQQFKLLMDMALNSGEATQGIKLYFFTTEKDNGYALMGENPLKTKVSFNQYELESKNDDARVDKGSYTLGDIRVLSGFVHKMNYGLGGEVQMASAEPSNSFIGYLYMTETMVKESWTVTYVANQVGKVSLFNQKTGIWESLENGKAVDKTRLSNSRDLENRIYLKVDGASTYLNFNDITFKKGGQ